MTLDHLIRIASDAYSSDDAVLRAHNGEDVGDTLALFIAREIDDTYDSSLSTKEQLNKVGTALATSTTQLVKVMFAFGEAAFNNRLSSN